jgi:hypothetical protein
VIEAVMSSPLASRRTWSVVAPFFISLIVPEIAHLVVKGRARRDFSAEAPAEFDTSEPTTGMTAAFTHDGNSREAVSAARFASSSVALSLVASCRLFDSVQSPFRIVGETEACR